MIASLDFFKQFPTNKSLIAPIIIIIIIIII